MRRRLIIIAWVTLALATLHFIDHAIRGYYVIDHGLGPSWNYSRWPFLPEFTPFTASLIGVYGLLGIGIWLTLKHRVWARYWFVTAMLLGALVVSVHFLGAQAETPAVVCRSWARAPPGILAVANTIAVVAALLAWGPMPSSSDHGPAGDQKPPGKQRDAVIRPPPGPVTHHSDQCLVIMARRLAPPLCAVRDLVCLCGRPSWLDHRSRVWRGGRSTVRGRDVLAQTVADLAAAGERVERAAEWQAISPK